MTITDERMTLFLNSLEPAGPGWLEKLEQDAKSAGVPIIRHEMQSFLRVFLELKKPRRILEVGTAVGFSALLMAEYTPAECQISTIEKFEPRIREAKANFAASPYSDRIRLLEGDAIQILKSLEGTYDFIFMDAAKGQYGSFLPEILRLMPAGGILISDNVLQEGDLVESKFLVERRNRTIYKRMREYLFELKHRPELITSIVPIGDGAAVSVRREEK